MEFLLEKSIFWKNSSLIWKCKFFGFSEFCGMLFLFENANFSGKCEFFGEI